MAFVDFFMNGNAGSSNLNSGSTCSDVGGGSDSAIYTSTAGNFDGTSVFTPTDGSTPASTVSAGMYASLYNTGDTATRCIAKITTVAAGVNGAITVDTVLKYGTVPTSNSGSRAIKVGGALADLGIVATSAAFNTGTVPQSTRINIKAGTYANINTTRTIALAGAAATPLVWQGYKTAPQDQIGNFAGVAGTDIPSFTATGGVFQFTGGTTTLWNLDFVASANLSTAVSAGGNNMKMCQVRARSTNANAAATAFTASGNAIEVLACYFSATTTATKIVSSAGTGLYSGCVFNGGIAGILNTNPLALHRCVFYGQAGDAVSTSSTTTMINCGVYSPLGNGVNITAGIAALFANNYFSTVNQASKAAINNTSSTTSSMMLSNNAYFNCTSNVVGIQESLTFFDQGTLASEAFSNPGSQNFAIVAVGQGLGYPGTYENLTTTVGHLDVGSAQSAGSSGANLSRVFSGF